MADLFNPLGESFRQLGDALARRRDYGLRERDQSLRQQNLDEIIRQHQAELAYRQRALDIQAERDRATDAARYINPDEASQLLPPGMRGEIPSFNKPMLRETWGQTLPMWLQHAKQQREDQMSGDAASAIEAAGTTPGQISRPLAEDEDPEAGAMLPRTQNVMDPTKALLARLVRSKAVPPASVATELLKPEETVTVAPGQRVIGRRTGKEIATGGAPRPKVDMRAGAGDTFAITTDPETGEPIGDPRALGIGAPESKSAFTRGDIEAALTEVGWKPDMPGYRVAYLNVARQISVPPGGATYGSGDLTIKPPPGRVSVAAPPGGSPGTRPMVERAPTPPAVSAEQTANFADFRTLLKQLDGIEQAYAGGASKYVGPVAGRLGAVKGMTGIGATAPEADFRAGLASIQNSLIYLKSGKQINEQEYARLSRELPDPNDPDPAFRAKLGRARTLIQTMLTNREAEFASRGYRGEGSGAPQAGPGATQSPPGGAPSTKRQKWGRDAQGNPVPLP